MKEFFDELEVYFKSVNSTCEAITKNYNFYVWQYTDKDRIYTDGDFSGTAISTTQIWGKPEDLDKTFEDVSKSVIEKINDGTNVLVAKFVETNFKEPVIKQLKLKMVEFINQRIKPEFVANVTQQLLPLYAQEQKIINYVDKFNIVFYENDGQIKADGSALPFKISGDSMVDIKSDLKSTSEDMLQYIAELEGNKISREKGIPFLLVETSSVTLSEDEKKFFTLISQTFTEKNKLQEFSDFVFPNNMIGGIEVDNPKKPKKFLNDILGLDIGDSFNLVFGESFYDRYRRAKNELDKVPTNFFGGSKLPRKYKTYGNFKLSSLSNDRKVDFTSNVPNADEVKEKLLNLYKSVPSQGDKFNGKIL
jgi:hypothetical protein